MRNRSLPRIVIALTFGLRIAWGDVHAALERAVVAPEALTQEVTQFLLSRVSPLDVPDSAQAWLEYASNLRCEFRDRIVFDGVPEAWLADTLGVVWTETIDKGDYRIRKLRYEALPGLWIPTLLYEPAGDATSIPAVLNVNGHVGAPGKAQDYEQIRCINLARRGMLALHPEWFACGELMVPENSHANIAYLDLLGVRGVSVFYLALQRAVDILENHPRTDPTRIAMTGLSGGGWQTAFYSALDERVDLIVPVAGHASIRSRLESLPDLGDLEQAPIDFLTVADYAHLTALFAPRPALLIYNDKDQCCFLPERTLAIVYDEVKPVYRLLGHEAAFEYHINTDPGTHNYELDNRLQFYRFISTHFLPPEARFHDEIPCDDEVFAPEDLHVGVPDDNATFVTLAERELVKLQRPPLPEPTDAAFADWQARRRALLLEIVKPAAMDVRLAVEEKRGDGGVYQTIYTLKSPDWTITAAHIVLPGVTTGAVTVVIGDAGIVTLSDSISSLLNEKHRVLAFDPLFMGRNVPHEPKNYTLAMAVNATGQRALGLQAGQIAAVCRWARTVLRADDIQVRCTGINAALAALVACNADPGAIDGIAIADAPESLSRIIEERMPYARFPAVFCYGLLKHFDMPELIALCHPATVSNEG